MSSGIKNLLYAVTRSSLKLYSLDEGFLIIQPRRKTGAGVIRGIRDTYNHIGLTASTELVPGRSHLSSNP